jgi:hypothetical protein
LLLYLIEYVKYDQRPALRKLQSFFELLGDFFNILRFKAIRAALKGEMKSCQKSFVEGVRLVRLFIGALEGQSLIQVDFRSGTILIFYLSFKGFNMTVFVYLELFVKQKR